MSAPPAFDLVCACGAFRATIAPRADDPVRHLVCHCPDCRAFARVTGREALLDGHGGVDVAQVSPAAITVHQGAERLACVRLSAKGLLRWRVACCGFPIAATLPNARLPFVGLIGWGAVPKDALGPVERHVFTTFALGDRATLRGHERAPLQLYLSTIYRIFKRLLRGERRSPFFDATSGAPVAEPAILEDPGRFYDPA